MSTCDPLSGYLMDEATASFFYGRGGVQRLQQLLGTCTGPVQQFVTPTIPAAMRTQKTLPLLQDLIRASAGQTSTSARTTAYSFQHGMLPVTQVLAGGAGAGAGAEGNGSELKQTAARTRITNTFKNVTEWLQASRSTAQLENQMYVTQRLKEVTDDLNSLEWDWDALRESERVGTMHASAAELLFRDPAVRRQVETLHLLTAVVLQVLNKHVWRVAQGFVPKDTSYDAHLPVIKSFLHNELYNLWRALRPPSTVKDKAAYPNRLKLAIQAVMNKLHNVQRALLRLNDILDDQRKWQQPPTVWQKVWRFFYNRAVAAIYMYLSVTLASIVQDFAIANQYDQLVDSYLGATPDKLLGNVSEFLKQYAPPLHTQFVNLFNPDLIIDPEITHKHFQQYMYTNLVVYLAEYMLKSLELPTRYMGVAIAFTLLGLEILQRLLKYTLRKMMRLLMEVARLVGLTRFVPEFDSRMYGDGILHVSDFRYTCVAGECNIVSILFRPRQVTYNSKEECLRSCSAAAEEDILDVD